MTKTQAQEAQTQASKRGRGRPPREGGAREPHTHRFDPKLFRAAETIAASRNETVTDILTQALESYVAKHGTMLD